MTQHTPGPWRIEGRFVKALKDKSIAECPPGGVRHGKADAANIRLIAQAPAMREAIERYVADLDPGDESYGMRAVLRAIDGA